MANVVLTIAGSDPSGGAGIQADLRTFQSIGVTGVSAITALTVQNSRGVLAIHPLPADVLYDQAEAVLEDSRVDAVKIGMLCGAGQVRAVVELLRKFRPPNIVLDPVLASTGGVPFLDDEGMIALKKELFPLCDLITPNLLEAGVLSRISIRNQALMAPAGKALVEFGARGVLVKGGHLPASEPCSDVLLTRNAEPQWFSCDRLTTTHTHGTGCALSSAIAAYLALGFSLEEAIARSKQLLTLALQNPVVIGSGRGYPDMAHAILFAPTPLHESRLKLLEGLYVLTDEALRPDRSPEEIVDAAFDGGARVVQYRAKKGSFTECVSEAKSLAERVHARNGILIVNDRVDIALASNADGVHLGPDDMHPRDARLALGPDRLIGVSVSSVEEARPIARYASYLGVGAIFGSTTKADAGAPVGLDRIREIKAAFPKHPLVAIGGIHLDNIASVAQAGADAAAVVSAVVCAMDMKQAAADLKSRFYTGADTQ